MDQSYWSVSSILADAYRLPCSFTIDAPGLSHLQLDPTSASSLHAGPSKPTSATSALAAEEDGALIKAGARLELPFWLAELLAAHDLVELRFPKAYSRRVRNALDASAQSVQLRNLNTWWYAVGARLGGSMEAPDLMEILAETYSSRIARIYSCAQHLSSTSGGSASGGSGSGGAFGASDLDISSALGASSGSSGGGGGMDGVSAAGAGGGVNLSGEMVEFLNGLDESERRLLNAGLDSCRAMKTYLAARR